MNKKHEKEKSLKTKDQIEIGADIDKYLEAIIKKYEDFIEQKKSEFEHFGNKTRDPLVANLILADYPLGDEKEREERQLEVIKKIMRKVAKKQKEIEKEKDEKRKLLLLAIKKIR